MKPLLRFLTATCLLLAACSPSFASGQATAAAADTALRLGAPFTDHAVLQAGQPLRVWGHDEPGTEVEVSFAGESATATAGADGRWRVELPAIDDAGPHEMAVRGSSEATRTNVAIGEVWYASGQSNMAWPLKNSGTGKWVQRAGTNEHLRYLVLPQVSEGEPQEGIDAAWQVDGPDSRLGVSGVAWLFAQRLQKELDRPVGVVVSAWGGSKIQAWLPPEALEASGTADSAELNFQRATERHEARVAEWNADGRPGKRPAWAGAGPQHNPSHLYHGMTHPVEPLNVAGVLWYQGESDAFSAGSYGRMFPELVASWREGFESPDLPVLFVQLPNFETEANWARFRRVQQRMADGMTGVEMAVTIDVGEADDIHPRRKGPVAERLFRLAMGTVYGDDAVVAESPRPVSVEPDPDDASRVLVKLRHVGEGLEIRNPDNLEPSLSLGRAAEKEYAPATVEVVAPDTLAIRAGGIQNPDRVSHAYANNPTVLVFNSEGLPMRPFSIDLRGGDVDDDEDGGDDESEPIEPE